MVEEAGKDEDGPHAKAVKKGKSPAKYVHYKAFGTTLNNYMNDKNMLAADVAKHVDLGEDLYSHERLVESARRGNKTSVKIVEAIAEGLGLTVPYLDEPAVTEKRSPFGGGRKKGGRGGASRARGGEAKED